MDPMGNPVLMEKLDLIMKENIWEEMKNGASLVPRYDRPFIISINMIVEAPAGRPGRPGTMGYRGRTGAEGEHGRDGLSKISKNKGK